VLKVARRLAQRLVLGVDEERRLAAERLDRLVDELGLRRVEREAVDDDDLLLLGAQGERRTERARHHLLGHVVLVVARLGREDLAASHVVRSARRALASVAGALLLVRLLAAAAHFVAPLGRVRAGTALGALSLHDLPQEVLVDLDAEDAVVEIHFADGLAVEVFDFDSCHRQPQVLISTSTPAERSSFISASSVCCVGSRMSSRRLCVRISNCSRDFLSTCGERSTQYLLIFVGSGMGPATLAPVRLAVSTISPADWSRSLWS